MGTNQQLTTEQMELLILINQIEYHIKTECSENKDMYKNIGTVIESIQNVEDDKTDFEDVFEFMPEEEWKYHLEVLKYYGYLKQNYYLSKDGRQYLMLFKDYLQIKEKTPNLTVHNHYSLIDIEKINAGLNVETKIGVNNSNIFGNMLKFIKIF